MTPKYLRQLANRADPKKLWRLIPAAFGGKRLTLDEQKQRDTGIALRRYAADEELFLEVLKDGKSILITPTMPHARAIKIVKTPRDHAKLRRAK